MSDEQARKGKSIGIVTRVLCSGGPHAGIELAMHSLASDPSVPDVVPVTAEGGVYRHVGGRYVWEPGGSVPAHAQAPAPTPDPARRAGGPSPAARRALARLGADPDRPTDRPRSAA